jgi:hypothetical protein
MFQPTLAHRFQPGLSGPPFRTYPAAAVANKVRAGCAEQQSTLLSRCAVLCCPVRCLVQNIKKKFPVVLGRINQLIGRLQVLGPGASIDVDQAALRVTLDVIGLVRDQAMRTSGPKWHACHIVLAVTAHNLSHSCPLGECCYAHPFVAGRVTPGAALAVCLLRSCRLASTTTTAACTRMCQSMST